MAMAHFTGNFVLKLQPTHTTTPQIGPISLKHAQKRLIFWCGGWDLNPPQRGEITRKSTLFLFLGFGWSLFFLLGRLYGC
jgi:hypothetical protein